jgi:hypothetical protein
MSIPKKPTLATPSHFHTGKSTRSFLFRALNSTGHPLGLLGSVCLFLAGCADLKVKKAASDSTPPKLVWNVYNHDSGAQGDHPGSPTLNAKLGERYRIILKATDPEGVKSTQLNPTVGSGEIDWVCTPILAGGENIAQNTNRLIKKMTQNLAPDANGYVLTSIFLIVELNFSLECQPGLIASSGTVVLTGRATNYFGGVTTEVLKFNLTP